MNSTAPVMAAIIQGLATIMAAAVGVGLWRWQVRHQRARDREEREHERQRNLRERQEQVRDMLVAIRAEIGVGVERLSLVFAADVIAEQRRRALERLLDDRPKRDNRDMPTTVSAPSRSTSANFVFDGVKSEIGRLPEEIVDHIVRYYRYEQLLDGLSDAFAQGVYEDLADARQQEAVASYFELGDKLLTTGRDAHDAITRHLRGDAPKPLSLDQDSRATLNRRDDGDAHNRSSVVTKDI